MATAILTEPTERRSPAQGQKMTRPIFDPLMNLPRLKSLYPHLSGAALRVYVAACCGFIEPEDSVSKICTAIGMTKNSVKKGLKELKDVGLIHWNLLKHSQNWRFKMGDLSLTPERGKFFREGLAKRKQRLVEATREVDAEIAALESAAGLEPVPQDLPATETSEWRKLPFEIDQNDQVVPNVARKSWARHRALTDHEPSQPHWHDKWPGIEDLDPCASERDLEEQIRTEEEKDLTNFTDAERRRHDHKLNVLRMCLRAEQNSDIMPEAKPHKSLMQEHGLCDPIKMGLLSDRESAET